MGLILIFWTLNWTLNGPRTHWGFFPLWLGYCLTVDGLVFWRTGTSLLTRSPRKYIGLFLVSAPIWWIFELFNARTQNWTYVGAEILTPLEYAFWTTLSFTTVIPAVFGSAEFGHVCNCAPSPRRRKPENQLGSGRTDYKRATPLGFLKRRSGPAPSAARTRRVQETSPGKPTADNSPSPLTWRAAA